MLDPSVTPVLRTRYTIRAFYLTFGALFLATAAAGYLFGLDSSAASQIIESFFFQLGSTFAAIMAIYAVWIFVTPPEVRHAVIMPIRSKEIGEYLEQIRTTASRYVFVGRSGNSFRSSVLPSLDDESRRLREVRYVVVVVPDPSVGNNGRAYASMMRGLSEEADDETLVVAVAAMALDLAIRKSENADLRLEMALSSTLPVMRMDLSEKGGVLTRDALTLPAVYCTPGGYLEMFRAMAENEFRQGRKVIWKEGLDYRSVQTADAFNAAFEGLPMLAPELMSRVLETVRSPKNRYA